MKSSSWMKRVSAFQNTQCHAAPYLGVAAAAAAGVAAAVALHLSTWIGLSKTNTQHSRPALV